MVRFRFPCLDCQYRAQLACAAAVASTPVAITATLWQTISGPDQGIEVMVADRPAVDDYSCYL
jgi:hypothetical protein